MTSPVTYPEGTISQWGINQALKNEMPWITYIGVDGSIFYLAGPLAPVPGAQNGIALTKHMGLMSPFELLKLQGARQDGSTWTDTTYDSGEIMLGLEASGITPQDIRNVLRQWISAWDPEVGNNGFPNRLGKLSVFTPDLGEWWANVRLAKNLSDVFDKDYTFSGRQTLTWELHNDEAFWYSVDSTSEFDVAFDSTKLLMAGLANSTTLPAGWTQLYSQTGTGTFGILDGAGQWQNYSGTGTEVINIAPVTSSTNNQVSTIQLAPPILAHLFYLNFPFGTNDCWVRLNTTPAASYGAVTGVRLRIGVGTLKLDCFVNGVKTSFVNLQLQAPPLWDEKFTLVAGTDNDPYEFKVLRDGIQIFSYTDSKHVSQMGTSYQGWGFGSGTGNPAQLIVPPPIGSWWARDNTTQEQTGFLPLTNTGDVEAWPRYLCYGPGTFTFGNGPGQIANPVTLGPLIDGQIVLVTTDPRFRSVVDLTPHQVKTPTSLLKQVNDFIENLSSFATNYNTPPLLDQFESAFGQLPPQGNLYSSLSGRFTNPIPRSYYGQPLQTSFIPVSITNAAPNSKIIAAITPRRRWPL